MSGILDDPVMGEIVKEFLVESHENLDRMDRDLVELEKNPNNKEILSAIFRYIHTIKGTCGFLGFIKLQSITHAGENLLSLMRDGELMLTPEITSALLSMLDAVREMLALIENMGIEGDKDYTALVQLLTRLQKKDESASPPSHSATPPKIGEILTEQTQVKPEEIQQALDQQNQGDPRHVGEILVEQGAIQPQQVTEALKTQQAASNTQAPTATSGSVADSSIRVDVSILDRLMNLVGELVLARNQIVQYTSNYADTSFTAASQRLNLITTELQENVMKTRMQQIGNIWSKFPRVVRDLSSSIGKQVKVEMEGKETELDKSLVEAIKDPLTHIIRNSVDHGIEKPEIRVARKKPAEGTIRLSAYHESGQVNIEITDDGGGIDPERVKNKALSKGLITPDQAAKMSVREMVNLIFLPGFSTAETVSHISGRGVGMDVVKTNIEKIGGSVDIQNRFEQGMTLKIKIPLTLAIIPALIVISGEDRYAIPQINLLELVRLEGEQAKSKIEMIHGAPVYRLRGKLLPIIYLNRLLKLNKPDSQTLPLTTEGLNIVVLHANNQNFGLVVDEIKDTAEIVVKPLGKQLKGLSTYAGATILGDGSVALILDVMGVAREANLSSELHEALHENEKATLEEQNNLHEDRTTLLLFRSPDDGRMAIPLSAVARLEEFSKKIVEKTGDGDVVQYRGKILPLLYLSEVVQERRKERRNPQANTDSERIQAVVYSKQGQSVGLVIEKILDIVEQSLEVQKPGSREGVLGTVVIQNRVTELLDIEGVVSRAYPNLFGGSELGVISSELNIQTSNPELQILN